MYSGSFSQKCSCGRNFTNLASFKNHQNACNINRKHLAASLTRARGVRDRLRAEAKKQKESASAPEPEPPSGLASTHCDGQAASLFHRHAPLVEVTCTTKRKRQLPARYSDFEMHQKKLYDVLPQPLTPAIPTNLPPSAPALSSDSPQTFTNGITTIITNDPEFQFIETTPNPFGLYRRYYRRLPSHDPEKYTNLRMLVNFLSQCDSGPETTTLPLSPPCPSGDADSGVFLPYPNQSSFMLGEWYWNNGSQKSQKDFQRLINIITNPDFSPVDIRSTNWKAINSELGSSSWDKAEWQNEDAGWRRSPVTINVPFHRGDSINPGVQEYTVADFYHQPLVDAIKSKMKKASDHAHFHYEPFELLWQPQHRPAKAPSLNSNPTHLDPAFHTTPTVQLGVTPEPGTQPQPVRLQGELYMSPVFMDAYIELQNSPGEPGCSLPRIIIALMFWSDSTQLTDFGNAKLWPLYMYFGNESKYRRCQPSINLCEHVAYFESLPDSFKDFVTRHTKSKKLAPDLMSHCRRELIHKQWELLLDDAFLSAYKHGLVIECCDGIVRRCYPRIFTYSADYPEKALMAGIRNLGACPCPRCEVPLKDADQVGTKNDSRLRLKLRRVDDIGREIKVSAARKAIYCDNRGVTSAPVERELKEQSLVPAYNAFSDRLSPLGVNFYSFFVTDLMHEVELGVWKDISTHLLRLLGSFQESSLHEVDKRFRLVPTFGRETIHRFSSNFSELKRVTAREFENALQCAIPIFEGLLPEPHNTHVLELLFHLAHWHALAKLRLHSDMTLSILDQETTMIGTLLRKFSRETCSKFDTYELRKEAESRFRQRAITGTGTASEPSTQRPKQINLKTYKMHSLGSYVRIIKQYGTTDSYSTELGELEHRSSKGRYKRTSKKQFTMQLAQIERRQARIWQIREQLGGEIRDARNQVIDNEVVGNDPAPHHHIGDSENFPLHIGSFLRANAGDAALKSFVSKLKAHLLPRLKAALSNHEILSPSATTEEEANAVYFKNDYIYQHNVFRINYTTYDVRRGQDSINPKTEHCNVMLFSRSDVSRQVERSHEYRYARVLGIYHANVTFVPPGTQKYRSQRMEFLWVRWFKMIDPTPSHVKWPIAQPDYLRFPPINEESSFGFVDPDDIIRACHIIPRFSRGKRHLDGHGLSKLAQDAEDWRFYILNRFVDRDMMMRYHRGLGVGHPILCTDQEMLHDIYNSLLRSEDQSGEEDEGAEDKEPCKNQEGTQTCDDIGGRDALEQTRLSLFVGSGVECNLEGWSVDRGAETDSDELDDIANNTDATGPEQKAIEEMYGVGTVNDSLSYN